jgi:hypothetical protein
MTVVRALCAVLAAGAIASSPLGAQAPLVLKARLATVPVEAATLAGLTGSGSVTATLSGNRLTLNGAFEGLQTPATVARLHVGPKGVRGPAMLDLVVSGTTSGRISADLMLTPVQADHVRRGRVYVQLHSQKAPDGNLWGWLLP